MNNSDTEKCKCCFSIFRDSINKDDSWICHNKEKPEANKVCWVLMFEPAPFIGLDYQIRAMIYDSVDDVYVDVLNGLKMHIDAPVLTYWKYKRK